MTTTFTILKDTIRVLLEGAPTGIDYGEVMNTILATEDVKNVHSLRTWALSLDKLAITAHIVIGEK